MYPSIEGVGALIGTSARFRDHRARADQRRKTHRAVLAHTGVNQCFDQTHGPERGSVIAVEREIFVVNHRAVLGIASAISSAVSGKSCMPSLSKCMLLMPHGSRPVRLR